MFTHTHALQYEAKPDGPDPDFALMRKRVKTALEETKSTDGSTTGASPSASKTTKPPKKKNTESEDVDKTCAYQPDVAATARPAR